MGTLITAVMRFIQLKRLSDWVTKTRAWYAVRFWYHDLTKTRRVVYALVVLAVLAGILFA